MQDAHTERRQIAGEDGQVEQSEASAPQQTGTGTDFVRLIIEPRERWPRGSPCAAPQVGIEGEPGDPIVLEIDCLEGWRHLPVISARRAA